MKSLFTASALSLVMAFSAASACAHQAQDKKETQIIKASYTLPGRDGEEFRSTMRESDQENARILQQIDQAHADLYSLLTAPEFDRSAFLSRTQDLRKLQEQMKENRDEAFASASSQLSQEERMKLASALEVTMGKTATHHHKHMKSQTSNREMNEASPAAGSNNTQQ